MGMMTRIVALIALIPLTACERAPIAQEERASVDPIGDYAIDPQTGEIRATHTDAAGVTTSMRSGEQVVATLPAPFGMHPSATITYVTEVEQGDGMSVTIDFATEETADRIVAFHKAQAAEAQIVTDVEVAAADTTTLAGANPRTGMTYALQVTRTERGATGQLSVESGFD